MAASNLANTHTRVQCKPASVGLAQACPNHVLKYEFGWSTCSQSQMMRMA